LLRAFWSEISWDGEEDGVLPGKWSRGLCLRWKWRKMVVEKDLVVELDLRRLLN
ncbi:unnamed protein product, partial [Brassica rapa subsp. trilocularis]